MDEDEDAYDDDDGSDEAAEEAAEGPSSSAGAGGSAGGGEDENAEAGGVGCDDLHDLLNELNEVLVCNLVVSSQVRTRYFPVMRSSLMMVMNRMWHLRRSAATTVGGLWKCLLRSV